MANPVGVFAHGIHLYAASVLICIQGVGSIKQFWHAGFVLKTARLPGGRPYCTLHATLAAFAGSIVHPCLCLGICWDMETFANSAAAVLLLLACSGQ